MSAHCKSPHAKALPRIHDNPSGLLLASAILFAALINAPAARAEECLLRIDGLPSSVPINYDPFLPANAPARMTLSISNPGSTRCEADLALVDEVRTSVTQWLIGPTNLKLEIRPSAGVSRASIPSTFSVAADPGQSVDVAFDVAIIDDAVVPAGSYAQPLTLELRQPGTAVAYEETPVVINLTSLPRAQMNLSGSRGDFGTGTSVSVVDFGIASTGKERNLFIQTRANDRARLSFRSANLGQLKLSGIEGDGPSLEYTARFDGATLDLTAPSVRDLDLPLTYAGEAFELMLTLGRVEGAQAGLYNDELTIEISTL